MGTRPAEMDVDYHAVGGTPALFYDDPDVRGVLHTRGPERGLPSEMAQKKTWGAAAGRAKP